MKIPADTKTLFYLGVPEEFSFRECLFFLNRNLNEALHKVIDQKVIKLLNINDKPILFELKEDESKLCIDILRGSPDPFSIEMVKQHVKAWIDLSTDIKPFYSMATTDQVLSGVAKKYYGLRMIGIPDLYEAICWAITGQHINLNFAYTLKKRMVENYGMSLQYGTDSYFTFPTPNTIAWLSVSNLTSLQFTRKKSEYIIDLAKMINDGLLSKELLLKLEGLEETERMLVSIRGVGRWTAHYVMMKCLALKEAFPIQDIGLQNALKIICNMERKPTSEEIRAMAISWKGWESYATFYLWHSLYRR